MKERYLLVKHSEGWNVDRCCGWMDAQQKSYDWFYPTSGESFPDPKQYSGVVVFGGAPSANDDTDHPWIRDELRFIEDCLTSNTGFFGICLGAQMLARVLGSSIYPHPDGLTEIGQCVIEPTDAGRDFLIEPMTVMQWHRESYDLPTGAVNLARSEVFENQAYKVNERVYGVQFHPEVNPDALAIWHERNRSKNPDQFNDDQRSAMMATAKEHDASVSRWLGGFLSHWTDISSTPNGTS